MRFHLKSNRAVGALVGSPMVARGPALVASPGQPAPVHINLLRAAGYSGDQRPGCALVTGGMRHKSVSSSSAWNEPAGSPFERGQVAQTPVDRGGMIAAFTVEAATAVLFVGSLFVLFFIQL